MANVNVTISPGSNAKKATYISDANILKLSNISQKNILYKTYGHVVEPWPDLEMNSAQVAFLDFVRPRCWTLAWSWNELTLLTFGHIAEPWPDLEMNSRCSLTATLLNPGLILKWTHVAHVRPRCWTLVWSWNELMLLTYGHVAEPWPDLEMNSAQVAFLDFVRPRCWTVVFLVITNRLIGVFAKGAGGAVAPPVSKKFGQNAKISGKIFDSVFF